jgi:PHD/YefM family antitoxin component YafN of YafNO toxin-antitoxin module
MSISQEVAMSDATTTRNFRENLKHFFDLAKENPIAINRGAERYVLMSEGEFVKMKEEVMNLQKSLISTLQTLHEGDGTEYSDVQDHHKGLLDEILGEEPEVKNQKKVAW